LPKESDNTIIIKDEEQLFQTLVNLGADLDIIKD
jgi:hypothetical protein